MSKSSFPFKLYDVLEAAEYSRAISWMPDGRSFTVYDDDIFVEHVLPKFSKATKLRSFHRQLNLWAFNRGQEDSSTWYHPLFIRGRPELLSNIIRVSKSSLRADTTFEVGQSSQESNRVDHNNNDQGERQSGDNDGVINTAATRTNDFPYNREEAAISLSIQACSSTSSRARAMAMAIDRGLSHQYQYQSQHNAVNSFLSINNAYESSTLETITSSQPQQPPTESTVGTDSSAIRVPGGQSRVQYPTLQDRQGNPPIEEGEAPDDEFSTFIGKNIHPT